MRRFIPDSFDDLQDSFDELQKRERAAFQSSTDDIRSPKRRRRLSQAAPIPEEELAWMASVICQSGKGVLAIICNYFTTEELLLVNDIFDSTTTQEKWAYVWQEHVKSLRSVCGLSETGFGRIAEANTSI